MSVATSKLAPFTARPTYGLIASQSAAPPLRRRSRAWAGVALVVSLLAMALLASSAQAAAVPLGTAANFAVLAGSTVTNAGSSVISGGSVGVSPGSAVTGFGPGVVIPPNTIYRGGPIALQAKNDLTTAYNNVAGRSTTETILADLGGRTLAPGVYSAASSLALNGALTLDANGDPNAVFVFQAGATLLVGTTTASRVSLINGAQASNVFWQVRSSATIGVGSAFAGNILALTSITIQTRATLNGRALARNGAVTLDNNMITAPAAAPPPGPPPCTAAPSGSSLSSGPFGQPQRQAVSVSGPPSDWRARALRIATDFQAHAGDPDPPDPEPATTVDPNPTATALERCARELSPAGYGGLYHDDAAYFVGFTSDTELNLARLRAAFPDVDVRTFLVRNTWDELRRIADAITAVMTASPASGIHSVAPDEVRNVVEVGISDPGSVLARSLVARYGDKVDLVADDPIELVGTATTSLSGLLVPPAVGTLAAAPAASPAPGRTTYRDPMLAGMQIHKRGDPADACTSGFMYRGSLNPVDTSEGGVITAGHCFGRQVATTEWSQGGEVLGPFTRQRLVRRTRADAGTITTEFTEGGGFRGISNDVYVAPGATHIKIKARAALNKGARGDITLRSGAYSGFDAGTLVTGGDGGEYLVTEGPFNRYVIFNVYKATFSKAIKLGDSGSPVFRGDGLALGILFARKARNHRVGFYSQIRNVENELRVPVYTGG